MGDSKKRDCPDKIGQFDSGLKYAIALCLRNNVHISIQTKKDGVITYYEFYSFIKECETGKSKELIGIRKFVGNNGPEFIETGFAKALGFNWEPWMILRELYSNMLDEGGAFLNANGLLGPEEGGTLITLYYHESESFGEVVRNMSDYILPEEVECFQISHNVSAIKNSNTSKTRIYKNRILVYEVDRESEYNYNISFGDLDERRILHAPQSVEHEIFEAICNTSNEEFLREIIRPQYNLSNNAFMANASIYFEATVLAARIAEDVYNDHGDVNSFKGLMDAIKRRADCSIPGRVLRTVQDSLWSYSKNVEVHSPVDVKEDKESIASIIQRAYNIDLENIEVITCFMKGGNVVADKHNNCIRISETFDIEKDMPSFLVEYVDLTTKGNVLVNLAKMAINLLKK